jgi:hypothetical protein
LMSMIEPGLPPRMRGLLKGSEKEEKDENIFESATATQGWD